MLVSRRRDRPLSDGRLAHSRDTRISVVVSTVHMGLLVRCMDAGKIVIVTQPTLTIQQAFELAMQHQQSGRRAEAEGLYRQILAVDPKHLDALQMLAVL